VDLVDVRSADGARTHPEADAGDQDVEEPADRRAVSGDALEPVGDPFVDEADASEHDKPWDQVGYDQPEVPVAQIPHALADTPPFCRIAAYWQVSLGTELVSSSDPMMVAICACGSEQFSPICWSASYA